MSLKWSRVLINSEVFEKRPLSVKFVHLELLLVNSVVSLFNVLFEFLNFNFLFLQLSQQILEFFLKKLVLLYTVEVINSNSGNLVAEVLNLDLFLGYLSICLLCLLKEVGR